MSGDKRWILAIGPGKQLLQRKMCRAALSLEMKLLGLLKMLESVTHKYYRAKRVMDYSESINM